MSVQTLYTAATGMEAMEAKLDVVANNLANVNTTAFKKGRANFEDLFYRHEALPGAKDQSDGITATGTSIGLGTRVSSVQSDFSQGAFLDTGGTFDVAIVGKGFYQVQDTDGNIVYTRAGNFSRNAQGQLVLGSAAVGRLLEPNITIPEEATSVSISSDGLVQYMLAGETTPQEAGQLELATFINPEGLLRMGENIFSQTEASGAPQTAIPGQNGTGLLRQGMLEASNVSPVNELIDLITTQRSFELNSQAIQAGDQILQLVANLRRY
ncbi:MAG: flagellar basal-body rod protein FlgG [Planctomycetes bacterium]|nr:flagellar basal-body rod protein FlgG [Planctomycetota bacterium]